VAGVVNAGFESIIGAAELRGLTQAQLSAGTVERLNKTNSFGLVDTAAPFLDITPMADDRRISSPSWRKVGCPCTPTSGWRSRPWTPSCHTT
jgi:hypothetical protein